jgi:hypothetical protein
MSAHALLKLPLLLLLLALLALATSSAAGAETAAGAATAASAATAADAATATATTAVAVDDHRYTDTVSMCCVLLSIRLSVLVSNIVFTVPVKPA